MIEEIKESSARRRIRNDVLLIAAVLLVAAAVFLAFKLTSKSGELVTVLIDGDERAVYSLSEDTETVIETEGGVNTLIIRDGTASISAADCPDGICVSHREISMSGETIVCLPHKLVIKITSSEAAEDDIIS